MVEIERTWPLLQDAGDLMFMTASGRERRVQLSGPWAAPSPVRNAAIEASTRCDVLKLASLRKGYRGFV